MGWTVKNLDDVLNILPGELSGFLQFTRLNIVIKLLIKSRSTRLLFNLLCPLFWLIWIFGSLSPISKWANIWVKIYTILYSLYSLYLGYSTREAPPQESQCFGPRKRFSTCSRIGMEFQQSRDIWEFCVYKACLTYRKSLTQFLNHFKTF